MCWLMNTYFYAASNFECNGSCQFQTCTKRCLSALQAITSLQNLIVLPGGSHLASPSSMNLRSGDLVLLYARSWGELEELIAIRDRFETFRVILIMGEEELANHAEFHLLNPRYTTTVGQKMVELDIVIDRITRSSC